MQNIRDMQELEELYPCRSLFIRNLFELISYPNECFPNAIFICGHAGTGKTSIIKDFMRLAKKNDQICSAQVNCVECYSTKIVLENTFDVLIYDNELKEDQKRCETLEQFVENLRKVRKRFACRSYIIVYDNADRLRDMDGNILPCLLRLQDLTGLNVCVILISQVPFEKYQYKTGLSDVISFHCPQYTKSETLRILSTQFEIARKLLKNLIEENETKSNEELLRKLDIIENITPEFYSNYLNMFLSVFYKACRELPELKITANKCFLDYMLPVLNGTMDITDISKLWRNFSAPLRTALSQVYMRFDSLEMKNLNEATYISYADQSIRKMAQSLELPFYAKYLLIAAFLASYNSAKEDKRLFVKHHGKQRKRLQSVNAKAMTAEKMNTSLGPKSFSIDRLLAIFYAILDEKVGLTCNLLSQISTLVHLKLLSFLSGESNVMDGSARLQCTVSLEFVIYVGRLVGFNVYQYLCDFM